MQPRPRYCSTEIARITDDEQRYCRIVEGWYQGGRAQPDFSLAWRKRPDIPVAVDTGRLKTDIGRQEF